MIDTLGLAITHGLILLAVCRLLFRPDLDDPDATEPQGHAGSFRFRSLRKDRDVA